MTKRATQKTNNVDNLIVGDKKVVVTGPGRSGTTFLVLLLTRLGFYTGFKPYEEPTDREWRAGAEFPFKTVDEFDTIEKYKRFLNESLPFIVKSPWLSFSLKEYLSQRLLNVGHVLVPLRDIDEATKSRLSVGLSWFNVSEEDVGKDRLDIPFEVERNMGYVALGSTVEACYMHNLPLTFLKYPDFTQDVEYCYEVLDGVFRFEGVGVTKDVFLRVFDELNRGKGVETGVSDETVNTRKRKSYNNK